MKRTPLFSSLLLFVILCLAFPVIALAKRGTVVFKLRRCDYFVVEYDVSYALLEHSSGIEPDRGDEVVGDFESFGIEEFYNVTQDDEFEASVEDYLLSKRKALEKLYDKCGD